MAKSTARLQRSLAATEHSVLVSDLLDLLKFLGIICILYFFNTIIFIDIQTAAVEDHRTFVGMLLYSFATLLNLLNTIDAISDFYGLPAALPNIRPLSEFLDIQQLHERRLHGFQVFEHFYTNYIAICVVWGIYCFLTAKLSLLLIVAQTMLMLSTTKLKGTPTSLFLPLALCFCIAPEEILCTWTIISYIVGHCVVMANPTRKLRFSISMFRTTRADAAVKAEALD